MKDSTLHPGAGSYAGGDDDNSPHSDSLSFTIPFLLPSGTVNTITQLECECSPRPVHATDRRPFNITELSDLSCTCLLSSHSASPPKGQTAVSAGDVQANIGTAWNVIGHGGIVVCGIYLFNNLTGKYFDAAGQLSDLLELVKTTEEHLETAKRLPEMTIYFPEFLSTCSDSLSGNKFEIETRKNEAEQRGRWVLVARSLTTEIADAREWVDLTRKEIRGWHDSIEKSSVHAKRLYSIGGAVLSESEQRAYEPAREIALVEPTKPTFLRRLRMWCSLGDPQLGGGFDSDVEATGGLGVVPPSDTTVQVVEPLSRKSAPEHTSAEGDLGISLHAPAFEAETTANLAAHPEFDFSFVPDVTPTANTPYLDQAASTILSRVWAESGPDETGSIDDEARGRHEALAHLFTDFLGANPWRDGGETQ